MKARDLRSKTQDELNNELIELFKEQFNMRIQRGVGQGPQSHRFRQTRRQIALIKTILREIEGL